MVTSKFDDSLDGSIVKPTRDPLLLDEMDKRKTSTSTKGSVQMIKMGEATEDRLLKMFESEEYLTAFYVAKISDMPARTAGAGLDRLTKKEVVSDSHEMIKSKDNRHHLCHVYRLVKKDANKGRKGKRNSKKV